MQAKEAISIIKEYGKIEYGISAPEKPKAKLIDKYLSFKKSFSVKVWGPLFTVKEF